MLHVPSGTSPSSLRFIFLLVFLPMAIFAFFSAGQVKSNLKTSSVSPVGDPSFDQYRSHQLSTAVPSMLRLHNTLLSMECPIVHLGHVIPCHNRLWLVSRVIVCFQCSASFNPLPPSRCAEFIDRPRILAPSLKSSHVSGLHRCSHVFYPIHPLSPCLRLSNMPIPAASSHKQCP